MRLSLYKEHLETLAQLQEMAKKHNCHINLIIGEDHDLEQNGKAFQMLIDRGYITKELFEEIKECYFLCEDILRSDQVWLELVETDSKTGRQKYNTLFYNVYRISFNLKEEYAAIPSKKVTDWIEENANEYDWNDYKRVYIEGSYTKVYGFEGIDAKPNVYREGILIREFGDLVCDYLKEPRIIKTY